MTEKQAMDEGYVFAGHYSYYKDEMLTKRDLIQKQSNEAMVVAVPPPVSDKIVLGIVLKGRMGYSVYWKESEENKACRIKHHHAKKLSILRAKKLELEIQIAGIEEEIDELN